MAEFISLYSGSSGNCSVVRSGGAYLLVDMGKGVRVTTGALREAGLDASDCRGILVTHEHSDHVKGLGTFLKRHPLPVYGAGPHPGGAGGRGPFAGGLPGLPAGPRPGRGGRRGRVWGAGVPHQPRRALRGLRITTPDGKTMAIATDLGTLTPAVHAALDGCDLVALESNYDPYMLHNGPYPITYGRASKGRGGTCPTTSAAKSCWSWCRAGAKSLPCATCPRRTTPRPWRCRRCSPPSGRGAWCRAGTASSRPSAAARSALPGILSERLTKAVRMLII